MVTSNLGKITADATVQQCTSLPVIATRHQPLTWVHSSQVKQSIYSLQLSPANPLLSRQPARVWECSSTTHPTRFMDVSPICQFAPS